MALHSAVKHGRRLLVAPLLVVVSCDLTCYAVSASSSMVAFHTSAAGIHELSAGLGHFSFSCRAYGPKRRNKLGVEGFAFEPDRPKR